MDRLIYSWYAPNLDNFLKLNVSIKRYRDKLNRNYIKVVAENDNNIIFKMPFKITDKNSNSCYKLLLDPKSKYRLNIFGHSDRNNKGTISLWVNSIKKNNNDIIRKNLEIYPVVLRDQTNVKYVPNITYDFLTHDNTNIWFGFEFLNPCYYDSFSIYKIELRKLN